MGNRTSDELRNGLLALGMLVGAVIALLGATRPDVTMTEVGVVVMLICVCGVGKRGGRNLRQQLPRWFRSFLH